MACSLTTHKFDDVCAECVDLNNPPYVNTFSPNRAFKDRILREFARRFKLEVFVESGTNRGACLEFLKDEFRELHSIELHEGLFGEALDRFKNQTKIHLVFGNSALVMGAVLDKIKVPALIFLDAHATGGPSADAGDPLPEELKAVYEKAPQSLAVLDDQWPQDFEKTEIPTGWTKKWYHGLTFIHKQGLYDIPERF